MEFIKVIDEFKLANNIQGIEISWTFEKIESDINFRNDAVVGKEDLRADKPEILPEQNSNTVSF